MMQLFGAGYSVYTRSARLALEEKGVPYQLIPIDIFAKGGPPATYLETHPFGRIPALRDGDFQLFETRAILGYVDEAFDGPSLQPAAPRERARMQQILSILDNYAYRTLVWEIYVERVVKTQDGSAADEVRILSAIGEARRIVNCMEAFKRPGPFLLGTQLTLADCHAAPILDLFAKTQDSRPLLENAPHLSDWLTAFRDRPSFAACTT